MWDQVLTLDKRLIGGRAQFANSNLKNNQKNKSVQSKKLKILGTGELKDKINIEADLASKTAIEKLENIGGSIQLKK